MPTDPQGTTASRIDSALRSDADTLLIKTHDADETRALGSVLGRHAEAGSTILLTGELGSGKTVVAQGIGAGLAVPTVVNSPTFVLVNEHLGGRLPLLHADLYRLGSRDEVAELALHEAAEGGVLVIEWPERAGDELPDDYLDLRLETGRLESHRSIHCRATGPSSRTLLALLRDARPRSD